MDGARDIDPDAFSAGDPLRAPAPRVPTPAREVRALVGKRVVVSAEDIATGVRMHLRDQRAASPVEVDELDGQAYVVVVPEADWYAWMADESPGRPSRCPGGVAWPADQVWVE